MKTREEEYKEFDANDRRSKTLIRRRADKMLGSYDEATEETEEEVWG